MPYGVTGKFTGEKFEAGWDDKDQSSRIHGYIYATVEEGQSGLILTEFNFKHVVEQNKFLETRHIRSNENAIIDIKIPLKQRGFYEHYGRVDDVEELQDIISIKEWSTVFLNDDNTPRDDSYSLKKIQLVKNRSYLEVSFTDP
jgi:hypothetical protein